MRRSTTVETRMLDETREDARNADQKASVLLAAFGIAFGALLASQLQTDGWRPTSLTPAGGVLYTLGLVAGGIAVAASGAALWPRYQLDVSPRHGIAYWGHIAAFQTLADLDDALQRTPSRDALRTRHQLWQLSRLVLKKYRLIRASLGAAVVAALLLAIATVFIH